MTRQVFKRKEIKFLIDIQKREIIEKNLTEHMVLDTFCKTNDSYMIYNIYFDTDNDEIIKKSLEKPYYKEKLRLRSYKIPTCETDMVFLELKKKIAGVVNKRRAIMTWKDTQRFLSIGIKPAHLSYVDNQVLNEITEFLCRYNAKPKVYLSYERTAYVGITDPDLRVTFDSNILTRRDKVFLNEGDYGTELLETGINLMEIKASGSIPLWLVNILSRLSIYPTRFSKYGTEYRKYVKYQINKKINYKFDVMHSYVFKSNLKTI